MRKTIQIVGVGERKTGVSKRNGKEYDFTEFAFTYEDGFFRGHKAEVCAFDQTMIADKTIGVGDILDVEMFTINFKTRIACIYG